MEIVYKDCVVYSITDNNKNQFFLFKGMKDCLFCDIYQKEKEELSSEDYRGTEIFYENDFFFSRFDRFPVSPGHALVIPKRHVVSLQQLTDDEWASLKPALDYTLKLIERNDLKQVYKDFLTNPVNDKSVEFCRRMLTHPGIDQKMDGYNHGGNEGEAAGRTIHHQHTHIIPRYHGDVDNPRGGIRHVISGWGNYGDKSS